MTKLRVLLTMETFSKSFDNLYISAKTNQNGSNGTKLVNKNVSCEVRELPRSVLQLLF